MNYTSNRRNEYLRRLQMTGGSTYIISLPKGWVTQNQLRKGSSLLIREEEAGSLTILPPELGKPEKLEEAFIKVFPKDNSDTVIRKTISAYLVGYSLIHIKAKNQQQLSSRQRNALKTFARQLLVGTEIVIDTPTELTLQVLLSYPELSVQSALRRMCIITSSMHKDALTALRKMDRQLAKDIIGTDSEVDRFHLYIIRQLKTAIQNPRIIKEVGLINARGCLGYRLITKAVERTADHAAKIAESILSLNKPINNEILKNIEEMSALAISMFETAIESLFEWNFNLAESVIRKTKEITFMEKEALLSSKKTEITEIANLRLLIESVRRTAEYASDIAEIVLNLTVESVITLGT